MAERPQIVVIDDDPEIRSVIQEILKIEGYRVACCPDGTSGLALITAGGVELVFLDWLLPRTSGPEVLRQIGGDLAPPPVIIFTAAGQWALAAPPPGAVAILYKPFDLDELLALVARYCLPGSA